MTGEEVAAAYVAAIERVTTTLQETIPARQYARMLIELQKELGRCAEDTQTRDAAEPAMRRYADLALRCTEALLQEQTDNLAADFHEKYQRVLDDQSRRGDL